MKTEIDNYGLLQKYTDACKEKFEKYGPLETYIPDELKTIIKERDYSLLPQHFSQEFLKLGFINKAKEIEPRFKADQHSEPIIDLICQYLRKDPKFLETDSAYSHSKGILIHGDVGCGKSLAMIVLLNLLRFFELYDQSHQSKYNSTYQKAPTRYFKVDTFEISHAYSQKGFEILSQGIFTARGTIKLTGEMIILDDLGSEPITTHFGNNVNIIGELLTMRYEDRKTITHATTNLDVKSLKEFYGDRVFSRMKEMFNFIHMTGSDRRK
jgi:hypothetical protein